MTNIERAIKDLEQVKIKCDKIIAELKKIDNRSEPIPEVIVTHDDYDRYYRCGNCEQFTFSHYGGGGAKHGVCARLKDKAGPDCPFKSRYTVLESKKPCKQFKEKTSV